MGMVLNQFFKTEKLSSLFYLPESKRKERPREARRVARRSGRAGAERSERAPSRARRTAA
jgi:hypothetical protein